MSIEAEVIQTIAKVELGDDYRVELKQYRRRVSYSPAEAVQLAGELVAAAQEALEVFRIDQPRAPFHHGFDIDLPETTS